MQIKYYCPFCGEGTIHNIRGGAHVDGNTTTSPIQCTECLNHILHVKHETGKLPTYESTRVLYPKEDSHPVEFKNIHFTHQNPT